MLDALEKKFRRYAIPNLTIYLVAGQAIFFVVLMTQPQLLGQMVLIPNEVLAGEWWRLLAFLFIPPSLNPIFVFFDLYLLFLMGSALEEHWGTFRYNLYVLVGYVATVAATFAVPYATATNFFLVISIFLAFAWLYPEFQIYLFFVLPIRMKWLAVIACLYLGYQYLVGDMMSRMLILAAVANYLLFFGPAMLRKIRGKHREIQRRGDAAREAEQVFHRCVVCGKTEQSHPEMEFRYCPQCEGAPCYCMDHIHDHQHK